MFLKFKIYEERLPSPRIVRFMAMQVGGGENSMAQTQSQSQSQPQKNTNLSRGNSQVNLGELNPLMTGIAGAILGAGIGIAGAYALRNDKTREKAERVMKTIGDKAGEYAQDMKKHATMQLEDKAQETTEDVKNTLTGNGRGN